MKISDHITFAEAIHSNTAKRYSIDNTPNEEQTNNMKMLAEKIFEPLRLWVGGPIKINSMFRSEELNKAIGGSSSSQHCKGMAMDIETSIDSHLTCISALLSAISSCEDLKVEIVRQGPSGVSLFKNVKQLENLIYCLKEIQIKITPQLINKTH
eukprot:SAG11_NODE_760_length_7303_cov_1.671016_4_plen_154_part_00